MKKSSRNLIIGAAALGAVSYIAGILTAPKKGSETIDDIRHASVKAKIGLEKSLKKLYSDSSKQIERALNVNQNLTAQTKKELDSLVSALKKVKESIKIYLTSIRDGDIEENEITLLLTDGRNNAQRLKLFVDTLEN
jgi:gas vesicle protein